MIEEKRVGQHVVRFVEDERVEIEFHGDLDWEDGAALFRETDQVLLSEGRIYVLCDVTDLGRLTRRAMHNVRDRPRTDAHRFLAYVGARFGMRVMIDLVDRASKLLGQEQVTYRFFDAHEEARAWLVQMRRVSGVPTPGDEPAATG
ncbi:STAS/SEC14 domain-containing protein [Polyangium aurulentum]|uniref:STAS/SEC14 domain-containing protein n=1 Tax=Polyangium aurulentum TaxID=2567896 RepID=UPI00146ABBFF|nr:STAS/SEC14 domain-containing protein [Polyangium aurulentum]UQA57695.1 STAS/SEC14 domain-containing protein [Polyangium aurulentum]